MGADSLPFGIRRRRSAATASLATNLTIADFGRATATPLLLERASSPAAKPTHVDLIDWTQAMNIVSEWDDLARRALDRNIFIEPAFATSAAQHFPESQRPMFLVVHDPRPGAVPGRLIGLCPVHMPKRGRHAVVKSWRPPQMALGTPLLDRTFGFEALDLMHRWMAAVWPNVSAMLFPSVPTATETARLLQSHAQARRLQYHHFDKHHRAVLHGGMDNHRLLEAAMPAKRRKELRRQRHRLEDKGTLTYVSAREPEDVRDAIERFLTLEAQGWKGQRHTALLCDPSLATFTRTMTRLLAHEGRCWVDSLEIDGKPIAMGIVLFADDTAAFWKVAYDESLAALSPGVHFTLDLTQRLATEKGIKLVDSCAIPDHPMINRLWPDRMPIADVMISTQNANASFQSLVSRELTRRRARAFAKHIWYRLRGRKAS
ncbi:MULTISPECIES: GNAT family N-acetyltransferase [unclassified Beijerinckia]|uniref:GNAT family N-acetyltransferase n=1 Tax=unclassified Beijerinckia TaxID=2638183 RepID=UPI000898651D|nr:MULTISPECIES: GNAT family N-acetyltransferase [unclassified Beijerinckia]MDH7798136.1 CelD/BcsL family acetyltransferase involved in cellulose biosynthesis [Beijerinckia sp. GAS462]SED10320.1 Acetyltransferase involved in cellulose biosynthesis, CelD/BcsL family [Beijerinckia sp. 28-YEA-48]